MRWAGALPCQEQLLRVLCVAVLSPCPVMTHLPTACRMVTDQQRVGGQHLTGTTEWYDINIAVPMAGTPDPHFLTTIPSLDRDLAAVSRMLSLCSAHALLGSLQCMWCTHIHHAHQRPPWKGSVCVCNGPLKQVWNWCYLDAPQGRSAGAHAVPCPPASSLLGDPGKQSGASCTPAGSWASPCETRAVLAHWFCRGRVELPQAPDDCLSLLPATGGLFPYCFAQTVLFGPGKDAWPLSALQPSVCEAVSVLQGAHCSCRLPPSHLLCTGEPPKLGS